ncbi:hypothetical protein [Streptomyces sp. NRRL B-24484]|uniref:hypothetical protein n=1 Tax=Streptomyces sp. NRRL B-24484 TaxID=1463833 RepID=UPI0004C0A9BF|nr:hypothetical protein [Streptomyces sp. NRRL B-24484]
MQIADVRAAIAAAAATVALPPKAGRLVATGYVPDSVTEPAFFIADVEVEYDKTMGRGLDALQLTCRVLVGRQDDQRAQAVLDAMLSGAGPASLKAAIEAARGAPGEAALGGLAHDLHIERVQAYRWYEHQGTEYVGAEIVIRVIGRGDS